MSDGHLESDKSGELAYPPAIIKPSISSHVGLGVSGIAYGGSSAAGTVKVCRFVNSYAAKKVCISLIRIFATDVCLGG